MKRIKFTSATLDKVTFDYYTLRLFTSGKQVYVGTLPREEAAVFVQNHKNVTVNP